MSDFKNNILKKASIVTISQILSLLVSALLILILPKFISVEEYGYWQLFILYSGYVGLFHLGYSDGLYIKHGGKDIARLNHKSLSDQFNIFVFTQLIFSLIILIFAINYNVNITKKYVLIAISVYLVIENTYKLFSFLLLSTDNSILYSKSVFIDKLLICFYLFTFLFITERVLATVIIVFTTTRFIALLYIIWKLRIYFSFGIRSFRSSIFEIIDNCKLGIILTISNIISTLILAIGRLFVEHYWSIGHFARISLAVSLAFFLLAFISQISLVLFPLLCRVNDDIRKIVLRNGSLALGFITMISFGIYFVILILIKYWLSDYIESSFYLIFLFPIVLFEVKVQVIYSTFCKSLNKLKVLLFTNLLIILLSVLLYIISVRFHSIELILTTMFCVLASRSIFLHIYLFHYFKLKIDKYFYIEILFSILFIAVNYLFNSKILFLFYISSVVVLYNIYKNELKRIHNLYQSL